MAHYLLQVGYTPEAWATMLKSPQSRVGQVRPAVERLGGKIDDDKSFFTFGEYDLVTIVEFPNNEAAAAFAIAAAAGGACRAIKTTPLMTLSEGVEAMRKAAESSYRPPA